MFAQSPRSGVGMAIATTAAVLMTSALAACGNDNSSSDSSADTNPAATMAASCGGTEDDWAALIRDAQEEGTVSVAGPPHPDVSEVLPREFKAAFDVNVDYTPGATGEIAQKIASERQASIHSLDVFLAGATSMSNVIYAGEWLDDLKSNLVSPDIASPEKWRGDGEGRPFVDEPNLNSVANVSIQKQTQFIINTDLVKDGEIKGWKDLLDPKWKGKMAAMDPTKGAGLGFKLAVMLNTELGRDFVKDLYSGQGVVLQTDDRQAADAVAKGRYAVAIGVSDSNAGLEQLIADGLPVGVVTDPNDAPEFVSRGYGQMGLITPAAHPNAGKLFANWILCPDGNKIWNTAAAYESARTDVDVDVPKFLQVDTSKEYRDSDDWDLINSDIPQKVLAELKEDLN